MKEERKINDNTHVLAADVVERVQRRLDIARKYSTTALGTPDALNQGNVASTLGVVSPPKMELGEFDEAAMAMVAAYETVVDQVYNAAQEKGKLLEDTTRTADASIILFDERGANRAADLRRTARFALEKAEASFSNANAELQALVFPDAGESRMAELRAALKDMSTDERTRETGRARRERDAGILRAVSTAHHLVSGVSADTHLEFVDLYQEVVRPTEFAARKYFGEAIPKLKEAAAAAESLLGKMRETQRAERIRAKKVA